MEARAARRDEKRARDDSPEMNKLIGGGDVMGGDDSFAAAKARRVQTRPRSSGCWCSIHDMAARQRSECSTDGLICQCSAHI